MQKDLIIVGEYCNQSHIDPQFIGLLVDDGLIEIQYVGTEEYIPLSQVAELEQYARLYYDLSINVAGLDAIHQLLSRMQELEQEVSSLKNELRFYKE